VSKNAAATAMIVLLVTSTRLDLRAIELQPRG
jgi:hypothetical protein